MAVTPNGKSAYVANSADNTVSQYSIDPTTGVLSPKSPATVATGSLPNSLAVTPDGKSAYVVNESGNTVSQYSINPSTGQLTPMSPATVATGSLPQAVAVTPNSKSAYVTNANDGTVSQYSIDSGTGALSAKSPATVAAGNTPEALAVIPDGRSAYLGNVGDNTLSQYSIDPTTGVLSPKSPATVATGGGPEALAVAPFGDVSVTLSAPSSLKSGSQLTYAIKVRNAGPSSAWQVKLKDSLPFGAQFQSLSATSGHCTAPKPGSNGGRVACRLGTIRRSSSVEVRVVVTVTADEGTITDGATASTITPDTLLSNNKDHVNTRVAK